nr:MAG TPA: protein of unknown function (DUF4312) [Caudoviricetes sp.]
MFLFFFMPLGSSCCQVFYILKKGQIRGNKCKL